MSHFSLQICIERCFNVKSTILFQSTSYSLICIYTLSCCYFSIGHNHMRMHVLTRWRIGEGRFWARSQLAGHYKVALQCTELNAYKWPNSRYSNGIAQPLWEKPNFWVLTLFFQSITLLELVIIMDFDNIVLRKS